MTMETPVLRRSAKVLKQDGRVAKVLTPADNDPAFHLEIPQPKA